MNTRLSIMFIFLLIFQSISSGLFAPLHISAEEADTEPSVFTGISYTDENGNAVNMDELDGESTVNVHVDWSVTHVNVEEGSTETLSLPEELYMEEEQKGALTDGEVEVGTFLAGTDGSVTVQFNEAVTEHLDAEGTFEVNAVSVAEEEADKLEMAEVVEEKDAAKNQEDGTKQKEAEANQEAENSEQIETEAVDKTDEPSSHAGETEEKGSEEKTDELTEKSAETEKENKRSISTFAEVEENIFTFKSLTLNGDKVQDDSIIDLNDGSKVELVFDWDTEGTSVKTGDTASIQLPETFEQITTPETPLVTSGVEVGTYSIQNGELIFVFNENIEDGEVSNGEVGLNLNFNLKKFEENIEQVILFNDSKNSELNVIAKPEPTASGITKEGHPDQKHNASEITWTVEIMNTTGEAISNATLSDVLPEGLGTPNNFVVTELSTGLYGGKIAGKEVEISPDSVGENNFDFAFDNIGPYQGYRVEYTTAIENRDATEFTNDATFFNGETDVPANATVNGLSASDPIEKSGKYNSKTRQIDWTIVANENGFNIDNAIIDDNLPEGLTVDGDSLTVEKFIDGSKDATFTHDTNNFQLELGETAANEHYVINFSTDIDYSEVNNGDYQKKNSFTNEALLKDGEDELTTADATVTFDREPILEKTGKSNVNYENKTLSWTIDVNKAKHPFTELTITDLIPEGLSISEGDIRITSDEDSDALSDIKITPATEGQEVVIQLSNVGTKHVTIEYTTTIENDSFDVDTFSNNVGIEGNGVGNEDHDTGHDINVPGNAFGKSFAGIDYNEKTMNWQLTVNPRREDITGLEIEDTFPNKGMILLPDSLKITLGDQDITDNVTLSPNEENGETGYHKGFTLDFEEEALPLNNKMIITYKTSYDPQEKIDGNFLDPHVNSEHQSPQEYVNRAQFIGTTVNNNSFNLPKETSTKVRKDSWNSGKKEGQLVRADSEGNVINGWKSGSDRKIDWQLYTNYQQQDLGSDVVITDTLQYEGSIDEDSIKVSTYDVNADGETTITDEVLDSADYIVNVDGDSFTLSFNDTVKERYVVEFLTTVPNISEETYTNEATVSVGGEEYPYTGTVSYDNYNNFLDKSAVGQEGTNVYIGDEINWKVEVNESLSIINKAEITDIMSAGLEYVEGTLEISTISGSSLREGRDYWLTNTKNEDDETELSIVLNETLTQALTLNYTTVVTAEDGDTVNNKISLNGENIVEETITSESLEAEQFSWVSGEFNENRGALQITKVDSETGDAIENNSATFELYYDLNGERVQFADQLQTDENGEVQIGNLPLRTYYLQEVEAPTGYIIDEEEQIIEVTKPYGTEEHIYKAEFSNTKIKTDISATKVWNDENNQDNLRPTSVEVQLMANGEKVENPVTLSDNNEWTQTWADLDEYQSNGEIINYSVEEVSIPEGYKSESEKDEDGHITITNTHTPETIEVSVSKEWDDANDQDGERPDNVTVNLLNGSMIEKEAVLNESNGWQHTFTDLPKFNNGVEIEYSVTEDTVANYSTDIETTNTVEGLNSVVTNTYTPKQTSATVTKFWNDGDNQDGNRPSNISVQLLADGEPQGKPVDLTTGNWSHTWENLALNSNGTAIDYTVEEIEVPEGYEVNINNDDHGNLTITNSYETEEKEISVSKEWNDEDNQDGLRPSNVTTNLLNGSGKIIASVVLNEDNNWKHTFTALPVYENGEAINYSVTEDSLSDYSTSIEEVGEDQFVITNSYTPGETTATVTKGWSDGNNQDGNRPESIEVQLKADGVAYGDPVTLSAVNNWTATWGELDTHSDGNEIEYSVEELDVPERYDVSINDDDHGNMIITNSYEPAETEVSVLKVWEDENNQDEIRPNNITVNLIADGGKIVSTAVLDEQNDWQYTFTGLPQFNDGDEISYRVTENSVPEYSTSITKNDEEEFIITNEYTPEETSVTVNKGWNDANNQDGNRPESIEVQLTANGEPEGAPVEVTAEDNWTYTWQGLDANADGEAINYSVEELNVPEEYEVSINDNDHGSIIITNSYTTALTEIPVTKEWDDDGDRDRVRPLGVIANLINHKGEIEARVLLNEDNEWQHTFTDLPEFANGEAINYTITENAVDEYSTTVAENEDGVRVITNEYTPEETSVTVTKGWNDGNNQDGNRPESIEVQLTANGEPYGVPVAVTAEDDWTYTWQELPLNEAGEPIIYSVEELNVPEEYEVNLNDEDQGNIILSNNYTPETRDVSGTKTWDDADNQDGIRPESITVILSDKDGEVERTEVTATDNWEYRFTNLPVYEAGEEIDYTIDEVSVDEYETEINGFDITNSYTPETREISGTKTWNDADNQDGKRPESITVNLLEDGEVIDSSEITAEDNWKYSFTELPVYEAGEEIDYTIDEVSVDEYETEVNGFDIKNSYTPETTDISGTKTWDDADNQDGIRPTSITVNLLADGNQVDSVTVSGQTGWDFNFEDFPVYAEGKEITYTVEEEPVKEYETEIDSDNNITNTHTPEETEVTVSKVWEDANNQDGERPESVTVNLLNNIGAVIDDIELSEDNNWQHTFTNLPKFENGNKIDYIVTENTVSEYSASIVKTEIDNGTSHVITNSYTPGETSVTVTKGWDDGNNQDGIRPESVQVQLTADGEAIEAQDPVTLDGSNAWTFTWNELPEKANGEAIDYSVEEIEVPEGYQVSVNDQNHGNIIVTNTHTPEVTEVPVTKEWDDEDNQDGVRPNNVTVNLLGDGEVVSTTVLDNENDWQHTFTDLPVNENGEEIDYRVTENKVSQYSTFIDGNAENGFVITNHHTPGQTSATVTKAWDDGNNQDRIRPEAIEVQLTADGETYGEPVTLTEANDWTYTWTELDEKAAGEAIDYSVIELTEVPEYDTIINDANHGNIIITNAYTPEVTEVSGSKIWDDADNQDGIRPDFITVNLFADGEFVTAVKVTSDNDWEYSFTELPKYEAGEEIVYSITEDSVENYETIIEEFDITNSYTPEVIEVSGVKTWDDTDNQDGIRPEAITVNLLANGEQIQSIEVTEEDEWSYNFTDLPKYKAGEEIEYSITENTVEGYEATINGYDITNTLISEEEEALAPESNDEPEVSDKEDTMTGEKGDSSNQLPATATNTFNMMLIGAGMFIIGLVLTLLYRKRKAV